MDLDKLKTFYQVATLGSIAKAVKTLEMDKSSISRHLSILEEQLGKKLFDRQKKQLILTPQGHFLLKKASHILMEVEAIKTAIAFGQDEMFRSITISATYALTSTWLSHFIHLFIEENPKIQINIKATNDPINLSLREADVAIRPYSNDNDNLIQKHLMRWRLQLFASRGYLKKFGTPRRLSDLHNHRILVLGDTPHLYPHSYTNWSLTFGTKDGRMRKPFLMVNSIEAMFNLVTNDVGIGSFSKDLPLLKDSNLVPILKNELYYDIDAYFIYLKQFKDFDSIKLLEKFLFEYVKKHPPVQ